MLDLEEPEYGGHLIEALFEAGPMGASALGPQVLSWQELLAWSTATGTKLTRWEFLTLRRMSSEYVKWLDKAKDPKCRPPVEGDPEEAQDKLARDLDRAFKDMEKEATPESTDSE